MSATSNLNQPVVLFDIPRSTYEGIAAALPGHSWCEAYDHGRLELSQRVIHNVSWESYEAILGAFADHRFRHTYRQGTLEMMSPSEEHEWLKGFIGRLIETAALELDIPIKSVGSTTRRHPELMVGLEPDESYFVQHEPEVRGKLHRDPSEVRPPDLVVEVETTHRVLDRLEAYAKLGVGEVWRYRAGTVEFFGLGEQRGFEPIEHSRAFPVITPPDLMHCLARLDQQDENSLVREFIARLRGKQSESGS